MTKLGQVLVLGVTALSLFAFVGALAVFTQHLNWFEVRSANGQKVAGAYEPLEAELTTLSRSHQQIAFRWRIAAAELAQLENDLPLRRDYYATLLELARTGRSSSAPDAPAIAFRDLKLAATDSPLKLLDIADPAPKASLFRDGKPLLSLAEYGKSLGETNAEIAAAFMAGEEALKLSEGENQIIVGTAMKRGLRKTLDDQFFIRDSLNDELNYINGPIFNRVVERGNFIQRLDSVRSRQAELSR